MHATTISDNLRSLIGDNCRVQAAVFTTYNFEPDFFEEEVVPLLLRQDLAFSTDSRVKSIQVREALGEEQLPIEVFYDRDMYRRQGDTSPSMEYLHHGIRGESGAFHAKLCFLLLREVATDERVLMVGAGSANLTRAGWWENVECQHWEEVRSGATQRRFINRLMEDVEWLTARSRPMDKGAPSALALVSDFLSSCRGWNDAEHVSYYGLQSVSLGQARRPAFMRFLERAQTVQCATYRRWSMDIISPYFADDDRFDGHEWFFRDLGVEAIRILLPMNEQGEALCSRDYYEYIEAADGIQWATWSDEMVKRLSIKGNANRGTHAKLYHLHNGKQSWVFVGSVNFTASATRLNQEAGFFVRFNYQTSLLEPLHETPEQFCGPTMAPTEAREADLLTVPDIALVYDWKTRKLNGSVSDGRVQIELLTPENEIAVRGVTLDKTVVCVDCTPETVEGLLRTSGFIKVRGRSNEEGEGEGFTEHYVLVQQLNWSHKPLDLPHLTPQEIVQIYAGLNMTRRNQVIEHLKHRQLREMGLRGETTSSREYETQGRQFFCEYAELFHAFRSLRSKMKSVLDEGQDNQVDYYLSGRGLDSLPTLFETLFDEDSQMDPVTIYLTLLCLIQIYEDENFQDRPQVAHWREKCHVRLNEIEESGQFTMVHEEAGRRKHFFEWYRREFFRQYWQVENEVVDETD